MNNIDPFYAGTTAFQHGSFWLLSLIQFNKSTLNAQQTYSTSFNTYTQPAIKSVGGKIILKMLDNVATVVGHNLVPEWDACTIISLPSPTSLKHLMSKYNYIKAQILQHSTVNASEIHIFDGHWNHNQQEQQEQHQDRSMFQKEPNYNLDMTEPHHLAKLKMNNKLAMSQIMGQSEFFIKYIKDERFNKDRVWQLNLLKYEDTNSYYKEYGARANHAIVNLDKSNGSGGGIKFECGSKGVITLKGKVKYNTIAAMQYPSREAFLKFVLSQNGKTSSTEDQQNNGHDRHALRTAGLEVQALVCLAPDGVNGIQDPLAPNYARL